MHSSNVLPVWVGLYFSSVQSFSSASGSKFRNAMNISLLNPLYKFSRVWIYNVPRTPEPRECSVHVTSADQLIHPRVVPSTSKRPKAASKIWLMLGRARSRLCWLNKELPKSDPNLPEVRVARYAVDARLKPCPGAEVWSTQGRKAVARPVRR